VLETSTKNAHTQKFMYNYHIFSYMFRRFLRHLQGEFFF